MKRLLATACSLAAAGALAYGNETKEVVPFSVALEPLKMHEECLRMELGEKRSFYWRASAPVDFNIHYHQDTEVFYPVKRDGMRGDGGTFTAKSGQDYCWMWTARDKPAKIDGRIDTK
jgi:hypothetical protein